MFSSAIKLSAKKNTKWNLFQHFSIHNLLDFGAQWGTRWSKHFYFVTSQRAQNYEAHKVLLNLLLGARTFVLQKSKFFQPSYTTTFFWFSFDFNQCSGHITFLYLLKHKTSGSQATMKRSWNELAILNN